MKTNIEIPVADLKSVLPGLAKVVSKKSSLPVLCCVKVTLNAGGLLQFQATDLNQSLTARFDKTFKGTPGTLLMPFAELTAIAKRCSARDTIELSSTGEETVITCPAAGTQVRKPVAHSNIEEFPATAEVTAEPVKLDDAFKQALSEALECSSTNDSRYVITGACLDVSKKEAHYVVGTDGRHLLAANSFLFDIPQSVIMPPGRFLTWAGFVEDGPWTLRFQPEVKGKGNAPDKSAYVRLDSDHWTYVTRPIDGNYPNWKQPVPLPDSLKSNVTLTEPGIKIITDALPLLPGNDDKDQPVTLEIKQEALFLKAGGTEIPIPARVTGRPVTLSLNRTYLAKALRFGCTQIGIQDSLSPFVFTTKGKTMAVCPLQSGPPVVAKTPAPQPISPPESASAENPLPAETTAHATELEERTEEMSAKSNNNNTMTAPQRGNLTEHTPVAAETSAIDEVMTQIETMRTNLRKVLDDLTETEKLLRRAVKEQKASDKEINRARSALRSLQNVEL